MNKLKVGKLYKRLSTIYWRLGDILVEPNQIVLIIRSSDGRHHNWYTFLIDDGRFINDVLLNEEYWEEVNE